MYTTSHFNFSLLPFYLKDIQEDIQGLNFIRIVFNINAVQYQTSPIHKSDKHIFAKIAGGGFWTPPPTPPRIRRIVTQRIRFVSKMVENIVGKEELALSSFPTIKDPILGGH